MDEELKQTITTIVKEFLNKGNIHPQQKDDPQPIPPSPTDINRTKKTTSDKSILGKNKVDLRTKKGKTIKKALTTISRKQHANKLTIQYNDLHPDKKIKYKDLPDYISKKTKKDHRLWNKMKSAFINKRKSKR